MLRRLGILIVALSVSLSWAPEAFAQTSESSDSSEYLIKAGFIYNFAKFVEWPSTSFAQPDSPIVIGIVGDKKIGGRGFMVKRLKWAKDFKDLKDCNILFVSSSEKEHMDDVIRMLRWLPILTIGETPGFAERGGIIRFTLEDNRVRLEANVEAARQANLTISSRLLTLARIIQQPPAEARKPE